MTYEPKPIFDLSCMRIRTRVEAIRAHSPEAKSITKPAPTLEPLHSNVTSALLELLRILQENQTIVPRGAYYSYMRSEAWLAKSHAMRDYFKTCAVCNSDKNLQVHHKHYENLGRERIEDLTVLCGDHHWEYEKQRKEKKEEEQARKPIMYNPRDGLYGRQFLKWEMEK